MPEYQRIANIRGPVGPAPKLAVGGVDSVDSGSDAEVTVRGISEGEHAFDFKIPRGLPGVEAVNNDIATRELIKTGGTETRGALDEGYAPRAFFDNSPVFASDYGAVADGDQITREGTDNTEAFRAGILAAEAEGRNFFIPPGQYRVNGCIPLPSKMDVFGDGQGRTIVFSTKAGEPVFASKSWMTLYGGWPSGRASLRDVTVRAEPNHPDSHGVVIRDYYSTLERIQAQRCGGDGFRADTFNQAGELIGYTLVENVYNLLTADQNLGWGFRQNASNPLLTDAHMSDVVARGTEGAKGGISIPFSAGWQAKTLHTYGLFEGEGMVWGNPWGGSILDGVHIEHGWTGTGLRIPNAQRGAIIDNIMIAMSNADGGTMLGLTKHGNLYPGAAVLIGSVQLASSYPVSGTGVTWTSQSSDLQIANLALSGENIQNITQFGGFGAESIKVISDARVLNPLRDANGGRTLAYRGMPLAMGDTIQWGGSGSKSIAFPVTGVGNNVARHFTVTIGASVNYDSGKTTTWVASVMVTSKGANDPWMAYVTNVVAPDGFSSNPTVSVTKGDPGTLRVNFTPAASNGYGAASITYAA